MSRYYLTEAYGDLYNPRKADETFYRNLKFVDYLQTEEIEEVMESLLWEFMDYGNTLDESYDLIEGVFSDDILEEVLCEAVPGLTIGSKKPQARIARITGAAKKAKDTVVSAASGVGKNIMSTLKRGKEAAAGAYERAKGTAGTAMAALKGLVRSGARRVALSAIKSGRKAEKAGREAEKTTRTITTVSGGGRGVAPSTQTTETKSGGAKRRLVGRLLQKAGKVVAGSMKRKADRTTDTTTDTKPSVKTTLALPPAGSTSSKKRFYKDRPSRSSYQTATERLPSTQRFTFGKVSSPDTPSSNRQTRRRTSAQSSSPEVSSFGRLSSSPSSTSPSGRRTLRRSSSQGGTASNPTSQPTQQRPTARTRKIGRLAPPTETQAANIAKIKAEIAEREAKRKKEREARKAAKNKPVSENYELLAQYILEDLINEGYADDFGSAMVILENLSDDVIEEMALPYLEY